MYEQEDKLTPLPPPDSNVVLCPEYSRQFGDEDRCVSMSKPKSAAVTIAAKDDKDEDDSDVIVVTPQATTDTTLIKGKI